MSHNSLSAIGLLHGAKKCANMPLTSRSLAAVFLIDNLFGLQMLLQRHALNMSSHTPFGAISIPSKFFDVHDVFSCLNSCQCISTSPSSKASTRLKRPSAAST
eukprot:10272092-Ditylum_brightwellii.AAC.1